MNDEQIIRKLMALEGLEIPHHLKIFQSDEDTLWGKGGDEEFWPWECFNGAHLTSHNRIQQLIDGLSDELAGNYLRELTSATGTPALLAKATPRQKCNAVLNAHD